MIHEIRDIAGRLSTRETDGGQMLYGRAIVFDSLSDRLHAGGREFVEIIPADAEIERWRGDVRALVSHDWNKVIGSERAGTLRLSRSLEGMDVEIDLPQTSYAQDLYESVRRGDIRGMSFTFTVPPGGDDWDFSRRPYLHTVRQMEIQEVTVTAKPAYEDSQIAARAIGDHETAMNDRYMERTRRLRELSERLSKMGG